jgi:parallel beta-helix repeat protein
VLGTQLHPTPTPSPTSTPPVTATQPISGLVRQDSYRVAPGVRLRFDPNTSTTLEMRGNLICEGVIEMRPARRDVTHTIRFVGVDNRRFVGGGDVPLESDVGLWVIGQGRLDCAGVTTGGTVSAFGETFTVGRNVRIEGTPSGKAHLFIRSSVAQTIVGVALRYMGAAKPTGNSDPQLSSTFVGGRYALHFHKCGEGSRGSIIENCVAYDADNRGFVPHGSHGITLRRNTAWRTRMNGFWWDPSGDSDAGINDTHDLVLEDCIAVDVRNLLTEPPGVAGFTYSGGRNTIARRCRAAGARSWDGEGAGHSWPRSGSGDPTSDEGTRDGFFEDCVSHDNQQGAFIWVKEKIQVVRFRAYRNALDVRQGAYRTRTLWSGASFESPGGYQNQATALRASEGLTIDSSRFVGPFTCSSHAVDAPSDQPVLVRASALEAGVVVDQSNSSEPGRAYYLFDRCNRAGRPLQRGDFTVRARRPGTRIEVVNADGSRFTV